MKRNFMYRNMAIAAMAVLQGASHAAQNSTNVEFVAAGLEEHIGQSNDRVQLTIYRSGAAAALHKIQFTLQSPFKNLLLPQGSSYRLSFESHEPDEEGATRCTATSELQVAADQNYRVSFTTLKRSCSLSTARVGADGAAAEIASVDGTVRKLPKATSQK